MTSAGVEAYFRATFNDTGTGPDRVVIDWGDGSSSAAAVSFIDYIPGATGDDHGLWGEHVYASGGNYTITATILGAGGAIGQVTETAIVASSDHLSSPAPAPGPVLTLFRGAAPFGGHNPDVATAEATGLYNMILGRVPDPAGQARAVAALKAGTPAAAIASGLLHSAEYETGLVASYYQNDLGRAASPAEVAAWVSLMQKGRTAGQVSRDFLTSPAFNSLHSDDGSFVLALYEGVLGRAPAPWEIAAWTSDLGSGLSRSTAVADFLGSPAAAIRSTGQFYEVFLQRPADPVGLPTNVAALLAGESQSGIAANLAGTSEFLARAKATVGP